MSKLDDVLRHHGIKGQKWGVIRNRNRPGGADGKEESEKTVDKRGKIRQHLDSLKREREWRNVIKEIDHISTKDINKITKRVGLENSLKKLSKSKIARAKDKHDYLNRHKMSDEELSRKVTRLRAKDTLYNAIREASKEQREIGERIANTASNLAFKYVKVKYVDKGEMSLKDTLDIVKKPKKVKDLLKDEGKDIFDKEVERRSKKSKGTP